MGTNWNKYEQMGPTGVTGDWRQGAGDRRLETWELGKKDQVLHFFPP